MTFLLEALQSMSFFVTGLLFLSGTVKDKEPGSGCQYKILWAGSIQLFIV